MFVLETQPQRTHLLKENKTFYIVMCTLSLGQEKQFPGGQRAPSGFVKHVKGWDPFRGEIGYFGL